MIRAITWIKIDDSIRNIIRLTSLYSIASKMNDTPGPRNKGSLKNGLGIIPPRSVTKSPQAAAHKLCAYLLELR